jgi:bifunctional enzyme CysN/CysC
MDLLRFTTAGSVDDGKSTLIGRLLHDTHGVYEDQLASVRKASPNGLDLAFITDGLRAEREQGITIDVAYRYFSTPRRRFIIADTPGHEQYTRNMVTGASTAELAVILLDVRKGVLPQTRRHAYLAWLLGIRRIVFAVNKMDSVNYAENAFDEVCRQIGGFTAKIPGCQLDSIPVSALQGDNVVGPSQHMPWFNGQSLLEYLETVPLEGSASADELRFPVQYVIRGEDGFRGYAGQIAAGSVGEGDRITVLPSGHIASVRSIATNNGPSTRAYAPASVTLGLDDHFDVGRGDMLASATNPPMAVRQIQATLVWMSETPMSLQRPYLVKHTSQRVCAEVSRLLSKLDIRTLEQEDGAGELHLNEIGTVEIDTHRPLFCDTYAENRTTGSFILIDPISNQTLAAGMISGWGEEPRRQPGRGGQAHRGLTVWFTGLSSAGKTTLSHAVYERLWAAGRKVEFLDGDLVRQHLCKDLGFSKQDRDENIRRIGFVADLLTKNGVIVLVSAISPYRALRDEQRSRIGDFVEVYVNAPLQVCELRDVKGLYRKARGGELKGFTGIDDPYEPPLEAEVECLTDRESLAESAGKVLQFLEHRLEIDE